MMVLKMNNSALQCEIWLFDTDPIKGNELGKKIRPGIIISNDFMNKGQSGLVIIVPMTSVYKGIQSHIQINPPEGGLKEKSFALCEQIRAISKQRLIKKIGIIKSKEILIEIRGWILDLISLEN